MSLLSRFSRSSGTVEVPELPHECGHWELAPRWDCAADIGKKERVVSYTCTNCHQSFSPEEAASFSS